MPDVPPSFAIATITRALNGSEEAKQLASLQALSIVAQGRGMPIWIADGGSRPEFVQRLRLLPQICVRQQGEYEGTGLVPQVKAALRAAQETAHPWILYTEPDKQDFFEHHLGRFLDSASTQPEARIIVAARDGAGLASYPDGQRWAEQSFNQVASPMVGFPIVQDWLYGPLLIRQDLVDEIMAHAKNEHGWGWRTHLIAFAAQRPQDTLFHAGSYRCQQGQEGEDDRKTRLYRLQQLAQNANGLAWGLERRGKSENEAVLASGGE